MIAPAGSETIGRKLRLGWTGAGIVFLWLALWVAAIAAVIALDLRHARESERIKGTVFADRLNRQLVSSEMVLKGFAALFGAVGHTSPETATRYVRQVILSNPSIYALEIVQLVSGEQLPLLVAQQHELGHRAFSVKSFSYASDRKWQPIEVKPFYLPIIFMEPLPQGAEDVLGLDMDSVPFLKTALNESLSTRNPVATHPFNLVEGNRAYVVFSPIPALASSAPGARHNELIAAMVVDATSFGKLAGLVAGDGDRIVIHHKDTRPHDTKSQLLSLAGHALTATEASLFPEFSFSQSLSTLDNAFVLQVWHQSGWHDLDTRILGLMGVFCLLSSGLLVGYLRAYERSRILQEKNQQRLWHLANHDALTGLPNRLLLIDRLSQLLPLAKREGKRLAVMFLDLDDFKPVNDVYGHDAGDRLLKQVADRLHSVVRAGDTVSRMGGDEFVVLLADLDDQNALAAVQSKIRHALAEGISLGDQELRISASIGLAVFPDDGDTIDALLQAADKRMYSSKHTVDGCPPAPDA